jgi:hypothetical protein
MFRSYDHKHVAVTEQNIQTSVALDGNPEPDLVHAAGCKQPALKKSEDIDHGGTLSERPGNC